MRFSLRQLLAFVAALAVLFGVLQLLPSQTRSTDSRGERNEVSSITFSPDGARLAVFVINGRESGFSDAGIWDAYHSLVLFDIRDLSKQQLIQREFHKGPEPNPFVEWVAPRTSEFAADGKSLCAMNWRTSEIGRWNADAAKWSGESFPGGIRPDGLAFALHGDRMAVFHWTKGVEVFDVSSGKQILSVPTFSEMMAISSDGARLAVQTGKGVEVWNINASKLLTTLTENPKVPKSAEGGALKPVASLVRCLALSPDGHAAVIASNKDVRVYSVDTSKEQTISPDYFKVQFKGDAKSITYDYGGTTRGVAFSPDGKTLVAWGTYGLRLFVASKNYTLQRGVRNNTTMCLAFAPDGKTYATGDFEGGLTLWNTATGEKLRSITIRH